MSRVMSKYSVHMELRDNFLKVPTKKKKLHSCFEKGEESGVEKKGKLHQRKKGVVGRHRETKKGTLGL